MKSVTIPRNAILFFVVWLVLASGCVRLPDTAKTPLKAQTFSELQEYLINQKPDLERFRLSGPFAVTVQNDFAIRLSTTERINTDLFLSAHTDQASLVIFLHGYDSSKEDHAYQARHLASWGMHSISLQLPNTGPWVGNGKTVAKIVKFINRWPEIIDNRFDPSSIILVGHSFGGAAVAVALGDGAPAEGGILLDPAAISKALPNYLRQIKLPVMVLGADENVSMARNRDYFYRFIRGNVAEISIKGASHEDAQYPTLFAQTTEESQIAYLSALTATAFSLSATGKLDYAWTSYRDAIASGKFFNAKKK